MATDAREREREQLEVDLPPLLRGEEVWSASTNKNRQLEYAHTHAHAHAPVVAELVALETVVRPSGHTLVYGRDCKHQHTFSRL